MSPRSAALLLLTVWSCLQDGLSVPSTQRPGEPGEPAGDVFSHHRAKRCSCSNQLDPECHYFCHLDIIWINTQSKTTLYGLGSAASRRRRRRRNAATAAGRCVCTSPSDRTCGHFCDHSLDHRTPEKSVKRPPAPLLSLLRALAAGAHKIQPALTVETEKASETNVG